MTDTSWSRTQALELRNAAAARAQMCVPIVQEAEELTALIASLDEVLGGAPTPISDALRELSSRAHADYNGAPVSEMVARNVATQPSVLAFLTRMEGAAYGPQEVAQILDLPLPGVKSALSRLYKAGEIQRPERGRYAALA